MNKKDSLKLLKTAKGQVEAVIKMVEDDRYCIDISKQILASISLLKKANVQILNSHLEHCVKNAAYSKDPKEIDEKIKELEQVIEYLNKII
ncbi:metal-sensing transcriptional repressor [Thermosipho atlanticus]|uniref:Copper-sensing transcriptional repressor CsoR n=1 Tax=Thermosipho atlanticus DSM 15807 TaxID=1123380 RepID=A0A1M5T1B2_9BACT|nr:metal-sensing transcriptional repressor [Thermosipho atlanticus]SHH44517.1 DNA-binding transcriptional regulator, FrmR family [Thermosipho atlanticus DSM 15807]